MKCQQLLVLVLPFICYGGKQMAPLTFQCDDWGKVYPEENNVTEECKMKVRDKDTQEFLFRLRKSDYSFRWVIFKVNFDVNRDNFRTKCVVDPSKWVWTFPGERGATHFLNWPNEYGVWSLGMLDSHSFGPMSITIDVYGNCPIIFGQNKTTQRIGLALINMVNKAALLPEANVEYAYAYVCYHERVYIKSPALYSLCLHIICPIEAIGYRCCKTTFEYEQNLTRVVCDGEIMHYDEAWWIVPFLIGILLFSYVPIILVKVFQKNPEKCGYRILTWNQSFNDEKWLLTNPLSFVGVLQTCFESFRETYPRFSKTAIRVAVVFSALSVLCLQILIHYRYDYDNTMTLLYSGVPLAFRSMVGGYSKSRRNFMPYLGGPYTALGLYLVTTLMLVCIPRDLEAFLDNGIPNNIHLSLSPLTLDLKTRGNLGAVFGIERLFGYQKIYNLIKVHIFMLLNPSFWRLALQMQFKRFVMLFNTTTSKVLRILLQIIICIPYFLLFCVSELCLALAYYGFPIFLFFQIIVRAYCIGITKHIVSRGAIGKCIQYVLIVTIMMILIFNMYILTVVFVDSIQFITRVIIFTFTGLIAYPSTTYGYFVFAITVLMYVTEAVQQIRLGYSGLFTQVRKCSVEIAKYKTFPNIPLIRNKSGFLMVSKELYFFVVSRHRPMRVQIFFSLLKLTFITFTLYLAIHTIVKLQGLWDINPLTQVVTALFICLVPKLWHKMKMVDEDLVDMRENFIVRKLITDYCRQKLYFRVSNLKGKDEDDDNSDSEEMSLLHDTNRTNYKTIGTNSSHSEDDEMRSDLLIDLANDA